MVGICTIIQRVTGVRGGGSSKIGRVLVPFAAMVVLGIHAATATAQQQPDASVETALLPGADEVVTDAVQLPSILGRGDAERYLGHYSEAFRGRGMDKDAWSQYKRQVNTKKAYIRVRLSDLSVFTYPGDDLAVISFSQRYQSDSFNSQASKRQFWQRESDGRWRIISEATL